MNFKSREKLLASVAALSLLGISPQQTFAAQITTNQAVQQTKKITGNVSDAMGPIIGATVKVKGTKNAAVTDFDGNYTLNVGACLIREKVVTFRMVKLNLLLSIFCITK